ncbi:MAG: hypothetical protein DMF61_13475 [Blastocatellia bacterium AA13]|nr:MAG: hypothetical protein DMF61_13475 [Blastocatellia bacterium AA13]
MKQLLYAITLVGLVCIALSASSNTTSQQLGSLSIEKILRAHNVPRDAPFLSNWTAEAVRTTHYASDVDAGAPGIFQRKLIVSIEGNSFRREKADPLGVREEIDAFDGRTASHSTSEQGMAVDGTPSDYRRRKAVEVSVHTFGLIPVLKELAEHSAKIEYNGRLADLDCFKVRTSLARISQRPTNSWVDERKTCFEREMEGGRAAVPLHLLQSGACVGRTIVNLRERISSRPIEGR